MTNFADKATVYPSRGQTARFISQENTMISVTRYARPLLAAGVALALVSGTGCSWIKHRTHKTDYANSTENRPLEVPPDLDVPDTSAATPLPPASLLGGAKTANSTGFLVDGDAKTVWSKVGEVLSGFNGVTVTGRAEAITSYDVNYSGQSFLVRVESAGAKSRVSAISPDGISLTQGPAAQLLAQIQSRF